MTLCGAMLAFMLLGVVSCNNEDYEQPTYDGYYDDNYGYDDGYGDGGYDDGYGNGGYDDGSNGGDGYDNGGSDNGNDSGNGSDNGNGGNEGGSGNTGGGSEVSKPAPPTNVRVQNYGSVNVPNVSVSWSASSGATSYTVYRSTSANGSYSQISKTSNTYATDNNVTLGKTYYYKVKASNSAGTSDYSDYAMFEYKDTRKPGPVTYGSCSVSGSTMTLRWSLPSTKDYGKPTKAILRIYEPTAKTWIDSQELSGTATSVSFNMTMWIDSDGYVKAGIILENDYGTGGGSAKVYDTKNKKWIN